MNALLSIFVALTSLFPLYRGPEYARVKAECNVEGGGYRNIYDPLFSVRSLLGAEAVTVKKGLMLHGHFEYGYDYGTQSRWRGWIDPYETPFMLCDSIPGNVTQETYSLGGSLAYPLGKWRIGIDAQYRASIFAKHKDLRNKNTRMDVSIAPGVSYIGEHFRAGLSAGWLRNTEQVEYMQVDASSEKYLFRLYGLWLYSSAGFSSAENRRYKENNGFCGDLSLEWEKKRLLLRNDFHVRYSYGSQGETGYNNLHYGDTRALRYSDEFLLRSGGHSLRVDWTLEQIQGYRSLQRQELDPASSIRRYFTYSDLSECYWSEHMQLGARYGFDGKKWSGSAALQWRTLLRRYREFPLLFTQHFSTLEPLLTLGRRFDAGACGTFSLELEGRYRHPLDAAANEISIIEPVETSAEGGQLLAPLQEEFSYLTAPVAGASLQLKWSRPLKGRHTLSVHAGFSHTSALDGLLKDKTRTGGSLSVIYSF